MLDVVEKVVEHAYKVTPEDIDGLRSHGFDDGEIVDIVAAAAVRCFISKLLDGLGAQIDAPERADADVMRLATFSD